MTCGLWQEIATQWGAITATWESIGICPPDAGNTRRRRNHKSLATRLWEERVAEEEKARLREIRRRREDAAMMIFLELIYED